MKPRARLARPTLLGSAALFAGLLAAPLMAQLRGSQLVAQARIYALLTPEQRQKTDQMREKGGARRQQQ